jgi:hypothetical protein
MSENKGFFNKMVKMFKAATPMEKLASENTIFANTYDFIKTKDIKLIKEFIEGHSNSQ